ncbi:MAG: 2-hydroxyacid dehydrogenase [Candidatus Latescibacterota bacterium]|jgi:phosphoglycerate dehydrogenase-like enzyme
MDKTFRVALTRDFLRSDGTISFGDIGLDRLDKTPGIEWEFLSEDHSPIYGDQLYDYDALILLGSQIDADSLANNECLSLVARFGVGYDNVDIGACTRSGVLLTITPNAVRRPVAVAAITYLLALSQKVLIKDSLVREGRWNERMDHMGTGLAERTMGLIGLGNIGREICNLIQPFGLRVLATDPKGSAYHAQQVGAELVDLGTLLRTSDFVVICCELNDRTYHLISDSALALMKESAYLINIARGPIVDQEALTRALQDHSIAGAGLDVFEKEPIDPNDPILELDNVIVAPHGLAWTDECFTGIGRNAVAAICRLAAGRLPEFIVNPEAARHTNLRDKLRTYAERASR